jgi:hypothetical protein
MAVSMELMSSSMLSLSLWTGMTIEKVGEADREFVVITGGDYRSLPHRSPTTASAQRSG